MQAPETRAGAPTPRVPGPRAGLRMTCISSGRSPFPWSPWQGSGDARIVPPPPTQEPHPVDTGWTVRLTGDFPFSAPTLPAWVEWVRAGRSLVLEVEGPAADLDAASAARLVSLRPDLVRVELPSSVDVYYSAWAGRGDVATAALDAIGQLRSAGIAVAVVLPVSSLTAPGVGATLVAVDARFAGSVPVEVVRRPPCTVTHGQASYLRDGVELAELSAALSALPVPLPSGTPLSTGGEGALPPCVLPVAAWKAGLVRLRRSGPAPQAGAPDACVTCAWGKWCDYRPSPVAVPEASLRPLSPDEATLLRSLLPDVSTAHGPGSFRRTDRAALGLPDLVCFAPFTTLSMTELRHRPVPCAQAWVDTRQEREQVAAELGIPEREVAALDERASRAYGSKWHELQNEEWPLREAWNAPLLRHMRRQMRTGTKSDRCRDSCRVLLGVEERGLEFFRRSEHELTPEVAANRRLLVEDIVEGRAALRANPLEVNSGISANCNIDCGFCHGPGGAYGELSERRLVELQSWLPTMMALSIVGPGEPLMSPVFLKLLAHVQDRGFPSLELSLTTNGTLLTPAWLSRHADVNWSHLRVSVNAGTAEGWRRMTGKDLFPRLVENLRAVAELRSRRPVPFTFTLSCVLSTNVLHDDEELHRFAALADSLGADVVLEPVTGPDLSPFGDPVLVERLQRTCASVAAAYESKAPAIARAFRGMADWSAERAGLKLYELLPRR